MRGATQGVYFEKEVYSLFANPLAERFLASLAARLPGERAALELVVYGVATDYCVKAAALGLAERGYRDGAPDRRDRRHHARGHAGRARRDGEGGRAAHDARRDPRRSRPMTDEKKEYPRPSLTADVVVVALGDDGGHRHPGQAGLRVLFVERAHDPFAGAWALPGGFVEPTETVGEAAARELREETSLTDVRLEELGCFSRPGRDPRGWVVTIAHLALVPVDRLGEVKAGRRRRLGRVARSDGAAGGGFVLAPAHGRAPTTALAFDHGEIVARAVEQLRDRVGELAFDLLPQPFKLAAARRAFEAILGEPVDPLMFERVLRDGMVRAVTLPARPGSGVDTRYVPTKLRRSPWLRGREA